MTSALFHTTIDSPIGELLLTAEGGRLTGLFMSRSPGRSKAALGARDDSGVFVAVREQLQAYFDGDTRVFGVPLAPSGTPFQLSVWEELRRIPYGETISYAELARRIGKPGASRAVGAANGQNPISLIIPCHRVIGADGTLTGYGGGLDRKRWLLDHEAICTGAGFRLSLQPEPSGDLESHALASSSPRPRTGDRARPRKQG